MTTIEPSIHQAGAFLQTTADALLQAILLADTTAIRAAKLARCLSDGKKDQEGIAVPALEDCSVYLSKAPEAFAAYERILVQCKTEKD